MMMFKGPKPSTVLDSNTNKLPFSKNSKKRVVVKVGSQSLLKEYSNKICEEKLEILISQIIELELSGFNVILVSSGAVACGLSIFKERNNERLNFLNLIQRRQVLSSIGQAHLISLYREILEKYAFLPSQILLTRDDFKTKAHCKNLVRLFETIFKTKGLIAIVNENDTTSLQELMFTDNDELSVHIASLVQAKYLILLTNTHGVYDKPPTRPDAKIISEWNIENFALQDISIGEKTNSGRGGIFSKIRSCEKAVMFGIEPYIASFNEPHILRRILIDKEKVGTKFVGERKISGIKKWLSSFDPAYFRKTSITVNQCLSDILKTRSKATSILPVGISFFEGSFDKGDVVSVKDENGNIFALGLTHYDSQLLLEYKGHKGAPYLIHYDCIYLL
jgi:glutamate 5-kinase